MKKKWSEIEIEFLKENSEKMSVKDISKHLERPINGIYQKLFKLGISVRKWTQKEDELLKNTYPNRPVRLLKDLFPNRSESALMNRATYLGLKKNHKERIKYKVYKHKVNHDFFKNVSLQNSYWAGFISADGWVQSKNNSRLGIKLSKKDIEHLKQFKRSIETESPIKIKKSKSFGKEVESAEINVYSNKIIKDLNENFSIIQNKTFNNNPPMLVDIDKKIAFIIGLLDGDGSVYKFKNNFRTNFLGTHEMLSWIKESLEELTNKSLKPKILKKGKIYSFSISNNPTEELICWIKKKTYIA